jgi:hypothetical protein
MENTNMRKNYIGICLDKSGSMTGIRKATVKAYNTNVAAIRDATNREGQDTILFSNAFGGRVQWLFRNSSINALKDLTEADYYPDGGTPLFSALLEMMDELKKVPDYGDPNVAFQILVVSDGDENTSGLRNIEAATRLMNQLTATDRWTFAFLLPKGRAARFARDYFVPAGNIREWDATERGTQEAFQHTSVAYDTYFTSRSRGVTSTKSFFTDLKGVTATDVKRACQEITNDVDIYRNEKDNILIREFCENKTKKQFLKGAAFYELVKTEKKVQDYKKLVIRDRTTGKVFGDGSRQLLGLPAYGEVKLVPGDHAQYDVFVQSTSVNRKLPAGTRVLYWSKVGVPYTEGVSAPWGR